MQVDWAEMPTRPRIAGRERRVYALICALPYSGASTAHFSFDMTIESFLQGHVRAFAWLGGVPRECVYDNLRSAVARRERTAIATSSSGISGSCSCAATTPFTPRPARPRRRARRGRSKARCATTRPGSGRPGGSGRWSSSTSSTPTGATGSRCRAATRPGGSSSPSAWRVEREALRPLPPIAFDAAGAGPSRVPLDGYLKHAGSFYRAPEALVHQRVELRFDRDWVWIEHRGQTVARYPRS